MKAALYGFMMLMKNVSVSELRLGDDDNVKQRKIF